MSFTFKELGIPGLALVQPRVFPDERGFFLETYKRSEFAAAGIGADFVQDNHSRSSRGTLRGLHYQLPPFAQGKLVRVLLGRVWDVAVDLRPSSPTFRRWLGTELSDENNAMLWIPPGFAHGFVALSETAHLAYKCTAEYDKASERGIRWDDTELAVGWPIREVLVSPKDASLPGLGEAELFG
ncbi:MAG TPA: dTDP-4-dehydrorhamnose 3,5-epimerase [Spirochaetales bacterium]|nr:dTDP-4-dehydrorhamnose 3,5-epimerase [Spirochaetales bacterium]HRY53100.1 dTDP-4-dehydrorhamnose 3,5-epimerase [Spirochaetia bacterium]HRZ66223.1 dTDP-4-dehydrorhamnose 3,5-epimerase [Spirochaetia bacterium]